MNWRKPPKKNADDTPRPQDPEIRSEYTEEKETVAGTNTTLPFTIAKDHNHNHDREMDIDERSAAIGTSEGADPRGSKSNSKSQDAINDASNAAVTIKCRFTAAHIPWICAAIILFLWTIAIILYVTTTDLSVNADFRCYLLDSVRYFETVTTGTYLQGKYIQLSEFKLEFLTIWFVRSIVSGKVGWSL